MPFLDSEPYILGTASDKFENGKARAIYSTGIIDYTVMTYVLAPLEASWSLMPFTESNPSSLEEIHAAQRRVQLADQHHIYTSMGDYADFNRQHTPVAQAMVFDVIADILDQAGASSCDFARASRWCRDAMKNQYVYFPTPLSPPRSQEIIARGPGWHVTRPTRRNAHRVQLNAYINFREDPYTCIYSDYKHLIILIVGNYRVNPL